MQVVRFPQHHIKTWVTPIQNIIGPCHLMEQNAEEIAYDVKGWISIAWSLLQAA